jgi:predicted permease
MNPLKRMFQRRRLNDDLSEEMRQHLEEKIEALVETGMPREEAVHAARRAFGNATLIEQRSREVWMWPLIESLWADIKFALRQLRKSPGFTTVAILTLALGIGANTAVFSVVDAVMLRPLPYAQSQKLIDVQSVNSHDPAPISDNVSYPNFFDWRAHNHTLEHLVSYHDNSYTLTGVDRPVQVGAEIVSWDLLPALGATPEIGRGFRPDEEKQGTKVALISHNLWISQFNGAKSIVGRSIHLSGELFTVIGVMPASFRFPVTSPENGIWTTLAVDNNRANPNSATSNRGVRFLDVIGKMKPGVTVAQVDQDLSTIAKGLAKQYPDSNTRYNAVSVRTELAALIGDTRTALMIVLGAVVLVLLIACGNIANLLLARMHARQREISMRAALGAGRRRIVRQLLVESLVLSMAGGIIGCGSTFICTPAILSLIGDSIPRAADAGVDLRVLAFVTSVSLAAALIFGIIPAVTASKTNLVSTLKEGDHSVISDGTWLRSSLVVGQVALGLILAAGAGLLIASFLNSLHAGKGFNPNRLLTFNFELPDTRYKQTRAEFYREYFDRVRALPGVQSAAGGMFLPMTNNGADLSFEDPEHPTAPGQRFSANVDIVSPQYFGTLQIPLLRGRDFSDRDDIKSLPVMIVNQAFAEKYFHRENALGKKLKPGAGNGTPDGPPWRQIVGVVGNARDSATQRNVDPEMYLPGAQLTNWCCLSTVMRTSVAPRSLEPTVRKLVASMDKDLPVTDVHTMRELMSTQLSQSRFAMVLLSAFAGLAIILTIVGLYGVMMYSVARRTREIGIRMALGAQRSLLLKMVLREAAVLLGTGIAIGLAGALLSASVLKNMLYGTGSHNPMVLILVSIGVAIAGLVAAYIPARRAASINPMVALRGE